MLIISSDLSDYYKRCSISCMVSNSKCVNPCLRWPWALRTSHWQISMKKHPLWHKHMKRYFTSGTHHLRSSYFNLYLLCLILHALPHRRPDLGCLWQYCVVSWRWWLRQRTVPLKPATSSPWVGTFNTQLFSPFIVRLIRYTHILIYTLSNFHIYVIRKGIYFIIPTPALMWLAAPLLTTAFPIQSIGWYGNFEYYSSSCQSEPTYFPFNNCNHDNIW